MMLREMKMKTQIMGSINMILSLYLRLLHEPKELLEEKMFLHNGAFSFKCAMRGHAAKDNKEQMKLYSYFSK